MGLALGCVVLYILVCMTFAAITMLRNLGKLVDLVPVGTRYPVFVQALLMTLLISPFWVPAVVVRTIRILWQELRDQCRSWDENPR